MYTFPRENGVPSAFILEAMYIYAKDCKDIGISGSGRLVGNGRAWWSWKKLQKEAAKELCYAQAREIPVERRVYGRREDGPQRTIHPVYCEHVTVRNVNVITQGPNTDGLNPDSCTDVLIEGCSFKTGDDCIAINAGMNEDGWLVGKPCRDIVIRNCRMSGGHGAVVIGSAVSGGVENVSNQAIQINSFYEFSTVEPLTNTPSELSDIDIENVHGMGADIAIEIKGLPEKPLKNISLRDISLSADKGMTLLDAEIINIENVNVNLKI